MLLAVYGLDLLGGGDSSSAGAAAAAFKLACLTLAFVPRERVIDCRNQSYVVSMLNRALRICTGLWLCMYHELGEGAELRRQVRGKDACKVTTHCTTAACSSLPLVDPSSSCCTGESTCQYASAQPYAHPIHAYRSESRESVDLRNPFTTTARTEHSHLAQSVCTSSTALCPFSKPTRVSDNLVDIAMMLLQRQSTTRAARGGRQNAAAARGGAAAPLLPLPLRRNAAAQRAAVAARAASSEPTVTITFVERDAKAGSSNTVEVAAPSGEQLRATMMDAKVDLYTTWGKVR